ncbi:hypothetical protein KJ840_01645 [Patescibacteria group bacterium]|nr:hypothetical protein [Patescibacteria group bacterium]
MLNKYLIISLLGGVVIFSVLSFLLFENVGYVRLLSPAARQAYIIKARDFSIQEAKKQGDYRCCINPPCTMCYMEPNQWNNYTAGTCACDDLIAQGKEPCPQCAQALSCDSQKEATNCEVDLD